MKSILAAVAGALLLSALPVQAEEASPLSFNLSVASDYRYRGISQTRLKPALQGGVDYALPAGFYIGAWASSIQWIKDAGGDAKVEVDLYGGYKTEIVSGLTVDVGVLTYQYPSNKLNPSANTTEVYGALSYGPATLKYSHSTSNLFGFADSKGSGYVDLTANFDWGDGVTFTPHIGHQRVKNGSDYSYTDYSLTLTKDYSGFLFGVSLVDTDTKAYVGANAKDLGKGTVVLSVKKTF